MTVEHPAKFSPEILSKIREIVIQEWETGSGCGWRPRHGYQLLDPFAGTGRIHELSDLWYVETLGVEIESEWAEMHERTFLGDALDLPDSWTGLFDIVATSPTYGNRMADHHNAKDRSKRITYKHRLGRDPNPNSSAILHFGDGYCHFHDVAWDEVARMTRRPTLDNGDMAGGLFVLNVSDFIRKGERVRVCDWHVETILRGPWELEQEIPIPTKRMGFGANSAARVEHEMIFCFRRQM